MIDKNLPKPNGKRPIGRPRALTPDKINQVLAFLAAGGSRKKAAEYVGVSVTTIADEAKRNEDFSDRLTRAESSCYMRHLQNVSKAGDKDWRASSFLLERKWPEEFGKRTDINVGGQPDNPLSPVVEVIVNSREEVKEFMTLTELKAIAHTPGTEE